jgi:ATP-dependent helicase YprA (DUF1998 family)
MASTTSSGLNNEENHFCGVLNRARTTATNSTGYSSASTRLHMSQNSYERLGFHPHNWQLDVSEAIILKLNTVILVGTGSGKTIPFILPLLQPLSEDSTLLLISPLKQL